MNTPPTLSYVCPLKWAQLTGADDGKFCETCGHNVHNISLLSTEQRAALLARAKTERICGAYHARLNGELVTPEHPLTARERRHIVPVTAALATAAGLAFAPGCTTPPAATPAPMTETQPVTASADEDEGVIVLLAFGMLTCEPETHTGPHGHPAK